MIHIYTMKTREFKILPVIALDPPHKETIDFQYIERATKVDYTYEVHTALTLGWLNYTLVINYHGEPKRTIQESKMV